MAATHRASASGETSYGSNVVINKPTGTVDNDLMIAVLFSPGDIDTLTGWTLKLSGTTMGGVVFKVFTKYASSEGSSYTWSITTGPDTIAGFILSYSGADSTQFDAALASMDTDIAPDRTSTADDETVVRVYAGDTGAAPGLPTGHTSRLNVAGTDYDFRAVDKVQATAGAVGTADFASSATDEAVATMVITNAAGGGGSSQPDAFAMFM